MHGPQCAENRKAGIESYRAALQLQPDLEQIHNNLGNAHTQNEQLQQALDSYRKALVLQADYPDALNNLGLTL